MPTLEQLPQVVAANTPDLVLLGQNGETCVVSVATLLEPVQPRLTLASGVLLGRASVGPGGPEPIGVGSGLAIQAGQLVLEVPPPVVTPPVVTGSRDGNAGLASLLSALATLGLIVDESTT
jgi:hypothetical protein